MRLKPELRRMGRTLVKRAPLPQAAMPWAAAAGTAGLSGRSRTALRFRPAGALKNAGEKNSQAGLEFGVKKPSQDCNDGP
jgi:hypothetical protein